MAVNKRSAHATALAASPDRATEATFRSLIRAYGLLNRAMQGHFLRFGISSSQWAVLRALHRAETEGSPALRLTDLGNRLLVRPPSVTTVVDRLLRADLISRSAASDDLRAKHVALTPAGRELVQRVLAVHGAQIQKVLGGLSSSEQTQLRRLLDRLGEHLRSLVEGKAADRW
jgi:DNA-binding MarR family transcriptional regulator